MAELCNQRALRVTGLWVALLLACRTPVPVAAPLPTSHLDAAPVDCLEAWRGRSDATFALAAARCLAAQAPAADDADTWLASARAALFAALRHPSAVTPASRRDLLATAMDHADRSLRRASFGYNDLRARDVAVNKASNVVAADKLEALYWRTVAVAQWAAEGSLGDKMFEMPAARDVMLRIEAQRPDLDGGGPSRWLGAYYGLAPGIAGGSLAASRKHFDKARALDPGRLDNAILTADVWARRANDAATWHALVTEAATRQLGPDDAPEQHLAQKLAQEMSRKGFTQR